MIPNRLKNRRPRRPRRMAREPEQTVEQAAPVRTPSKLDRVEQLLLAEGGATIAELIAATGWLQHSVRGALAGALKKRGLVIASEKIDGVRRYRGTRPE